MNLELPESRPTLWTEYDRYEPGDVLRANCSSPPSRPQAELTLTINNIVVSSHENKFSVSTFLFLLKQSFELKLSTKASLKKKKKEGKMSGRERETTCSIQNFNDLNKCMHLIYPSVAVEETVFTTDTHTNSYEFSLRGFVLLWLFSFCHKTNILSYFWTTFKINFVVHTFPVFGWSKENEQILAISNIRWNHPDVFLWRKFS